MKESAMPWVKIFTEIIDDPKIGRLSKAAKWRFLELIVLAGECDADGYLVHSDQPLTLDEIAWRLRDTRAQLESDLFELAAQELVKNDGGALTVINFSKRQGRSQNSKREQWKAHQAVRRDKVRSIVYKRSGGKCEYCDKPLSEDAFVVEHITPPFRGGSYTSLDNLACACQHCNAKKGDKTLEELGWKNPRASDDSAKVIYDSDKVITLEGEGEGEKEGEKSSPAQAPEPPANPAPKNLPEEPKPETANGKNPDHQALFTAIADCCQLNTRLMGKRIGVAAQTLWHDVHATPSQVKVFKDWWFANDWRGKRGSPPTLSQLGEYWQQAQDAATCGQVFANAAKQPNRQSEPKGFAAIREAMQDPRYQE